MPKVINLPETKSGITILDDNTRIYWTDGWSLVTIAFPNGSRERFYSDSNHPLIAESDRVRADSGTEVIVGGSQDEMEWLTNRLAT